MVRKGVTSVLTFTLWILDATVGLCSIRILNMVDQSDNLTATFWKKVNWKDFSQVLKQKVRGVNLQNSFQCHWPHSNLSGYIQGEYPPVQP